MTIIVFTEMLTGKKHIFNDKEGGAAQCRPLSVSAHSAKFF